MSTLSVGTIQSNTTSPPTINNSGGTQIGTFCRAWVNFNGTLVTNPASMTGVRASFNVSSILDNGVGDYTINFATAMPDANYAVSGCQGGGNNYAWRTYEDATPRTASLVRVYMVNAAFNNADPSQANFAIFR